MDIYTKLEIWIDISETKQIIVIRSILMYKKYTHSMNDHILIMKSQLIR